jgi:predicted AlkP superfamily phosphohydrolase/phosphomutase
MRAFALPGFYDAAIRVNLAGRDARGMVATGDYTPECDRLETMLRGLRNPYTGNPVVTGVLRPRADDPYAPSATDADLVVSWAEPACAFDHPTVGIVGPYPMRRPGGHGDPVGFVAIRGPGLPVGHVGTRLPPDVPATVLALLGRALNPGMEGTPVAHRQALAAD